MFGGMLGWFEKLVVRSKESGASQTENQSPDRPPAESSADSAAGKGEPTQPGANRTDPAAPEDRTSVPVMIEILKILSRIEYGLEVEQIAESLAISLEDALANCAALDQEALIHHHEGLQQWFIGQRGLDFLRLNNDLEPKP